MLSRKSTTTSLLNSFNDWSLALKRKRYVDVAFIDFAIAFDSVHILSYLLSYNLMVLQATYIWIINVLLNRTINTRVGSAYSTSLDLKSGYVQGCCIGPMLFIIYINDVSDLFNGNIKSSLYADDVKLYSVIDSEDDCIILVGNLRTCRMVSKMATQNILHEVHD